MSKHTPGPWVQFYLEGKPHSIMPAMREGDICVFAVPPTEADSRLMNAAPELLSALKGLVHLFRGYQGLELLAARLAIAKAEGQS